MERDRQNDVIGVDGFNLSLEEGTGVATYARQLAATATQLGLGVHLLYGRRELKTRDPQLREILFFDRPLPTKKGWRADLEFDLAMARGMTGVAAREVPISGRVARDVLEAGLPPFEAIYNVDNLFELANWHFRLFRRRLRVRMPQPPRVMHWTYPLPVMVEGALNLYTLHDLVPLKLPATTLDRKGRYLRLVRHLARVADHIVTVSERSKADIVELLGAEERRVTNTYQAVQVPEPVLGKTEAEVAAEVKHLFGLTAGGYFLFFGAIEPKKNIPRLLEAYLSAGVDSPLVLVGRPAWDAEKQLRLYEVTKQRARETGGTGRGVGPILHLEYLPRDLLFTLVRGAKAVLFPSLYEGFGLPALEAMSLGTPLITSSGGSLPEVVGDGALVCDPYDVRGLKEAIQRIEADDALRQALRGRGRAQAAKFSVDRYAERLQALYANLEPARR